MYTLAHVYAKHEEVKYNIEYDYVRAADKLSSMF
jgi:hypothetical protein